MKQRITQEQLNELSNSASKKLIEWMLEHLDYDNYEESKAPSFPEMNIGQLIEFLDEEYGAWKMESWQEWEIVDTEMNKNITLSKSAELCDALWEVVKEVLERGDEKTN